MSVHSRLPWEASSSSTAWIASAGSRREIAELWKSGRSAASARSSTEIECTWGSVLILKMMKT